MSKIVPSFPDFPHVFLNCVSEKGLMINLPRLMGIGIVLALLATQAQTAALAHTTRESQTELMKKRMQTLFPVLTMS